MVLEAVTKNIKDIFLYNRNILFLVSEGVFLGKGRGFG
jgi:hypothetical protein